MLCVSASQRKPFPTPSLNMASENIILTQHTELNVSAPSLNIVTET
jgi:hypothetical protein